MRLVVIRIAVKIAVLYGARPNWRSDVVEPARKKRIRRDPDTTRGLILDATEQLMVDEGYAAVSSRRIAQILEINAATVHYYYPTTDDLFLALHRRMMERQKAGLEAVLLADAPLEALWKFQSEWDQTALGVEFIALSNHRKSLRPVLAEVTNAAREKQVRALETAVVLDPDSPVPLSPVALTTILIAIARTLTNEERVGITHGHDEVRRFVGWALRQLAPADA